MALTSPSTYIGLLSARAYLRDDLRSAIPAEISPDFMPTIPYFPIHVWFSRELHITPEHIEYSSMADSLSPR